MDKATRIGLADLPQFTIGSVRRRGSDLVLLGTFNRSRGVDRGLAFLYRPHSASVLGDLVSFDQDSRLGEFIFDAPEPEPEITVGLSLPYFSAYFKPDVVDMILDADQKWTRVEFKPTDSIRFVTRPGQGHFEMEAGLEIPGDARAVETIRAGWDKETCALCDQRIGQGGEPFGYRDPHDAASGFNSIGPWLCEADHSRYAMTHDLGFLL